MLSRKPLVSFVIPCYNYGKYLSECLKSIFAQEGNYDFEVIVINDGSTDNTEEILHLFPDARLRIIRHALNLGHAVTINEGLSQARGAFIARIDPDDRYRPYFFSVVLEKFSDFPEVGLVYGDAALINEDGQITLNGCDRVHKGKDFKGSEFIKLLENNFICSPTVIARREAWQKALPVPKDLAFHDWYFTLMMAWEFEFYYINRILAEYRVHPENLHGKLVRNKKEEESVFLLLERIFIEHENNFALELKKEQVKRRVYAAHYLTLANKYLGLHMQQDAKRCYLEAIRFRPRYLFRFDLLRRLSATLIGLKVYELSKSLIRIMIKTTLNLVRTISFNK